MTAPSELLRRRFPLDEIPCFRFEPSGTDRRPLRARLADIRLCGRPEIANLSIQRSLERRPSSTADDVSGKVLVACDDVGMFHGWLS